MEYGEELTLVKNALSKSRVNYEQNMRQVGEVIRLCHLEERENCSEILDEGLHILSANAGSHTDLDVLESVLDNLYDAGIIDSDKYELTVKKSACGRWL